MDPPHNLTHVTIILVTYNSAHCLPLLTATLTETPNIILVDNNSHDGTTAIAQELLPHAKIIHNKVNRGFGAANNQALHDVKTPFALLLNPDCIITPDSLLKLIDYALSQSDAFIIAPQIVDAKYQPEVNYRWPNYSWKSKGPKAEGPCCVGFACGACLLLNMSLSEKVGFFDENFFLYYEDDDLCTRAFLHNLPIVIVPQAIAIHNSRGSVGGKFRWRSEYFRGFHHAQSKLLYYQKYKNSSASKARTRLLISSILLIPLRVIFFSPHLIARLAGRIVGTYKYKDIT